MRYKLIFNAEGSAIRAERVVIIIPTYNEALIVKTTVEQVFASVESTSQYEIHVLIFDSASTDATVKIVTSLQGQYPRLHLRNETTKSGLGSAYLQAMNYALTYLNADIVFEFDADLSHQPKYILPMLARLKDYDCVIGSRYVKGGHIPKNWGVHRKLFSIFGNYIARTILTPRYKDFTSGFRATRRKLLVEILPQQFLSKHFAYKMHLLWLMHKNKAKISEYPIEFIDRNLGYSKLPKNSIFDSLRVIFTLRFYEMKRYLKMCMVGALGIVIQFIAYNVLREYLHFSSFDAARVAILTAIINNFILNSKITFHVKNKISWPLKIKRFFLFIIYSVILIEVQSHWLHVGVFYWGGGLLRENIIMGIGIGLMSLINYYTYSRYIWSEKFMLGVAIKR